MKKQYQSKEKEKGKKEKDGVNISRTEEERDVYLLYNDIQGVEMEQDIGLEEGQPNKKNQLKKKTRTRRIEKMFCSMTNNQCIWHRQKRTKKDEGKEKAGVRARAQGKRKGQLKA